MRRPNATTIVTVGVIAGLAWAASLRATVLFYTLLTELAIACSIPHRRVVAFDIGS